MSKKYSDLEVGIAVVIVISVFYVFFSLNSGTEIMAVEYYDAQGDYFGEDTLEVTSGVFLSQSLFSEKRLSDLFTLQSSIPIKDDPVDETNIVFRAEVQNPFATSAELTHLLIYKNGEQYGNKVFLKKYLSQGESFIFKTEPIDLDGIDAQRNVVQLVFTFENGADKRQSVTYEFNYLYLTQCTSNAQCSLPNVECDIHNKARFSKDASTFFCARPCNSNVDCPADQLCIRGACGY